MPLSLSCTCTWLSLSLDIWVGIDGWLGNFSSDFYSKILLAERNFLWGEFNFKSSISNFGLLGDFRGFSAARFGFGFGKECGIGVGNCSGGWRGNFLFMSFWFSTVSWFRFGFGLATGLGLALGIGLALGLGLALLFLLDILSSFLFLVFCVCLKFAGQNLLLL